MSTPRYVKYQDGKYSTGSAGGGGNVNDVLVDGISVVNQQGDAEIELNDFFKQQIVKIVYQAPSAISLSVQSDTKIDIDSLIPAGYEPFSITIERYLSEANVTIESVLYKERNNTWRVKIYNWYTATISIQPQINIYCIKTTALTTL